MSGFAVYAYLVLLRTIYWLWRDLQLSTAKVAQPIHPLKSRWPSTNKKVVDMDDFIVPDEDDLSAEPVVARKKKTSASVSRKTSVKPSSPPALPTDESEEIPAASTARQWTFDPDAPPSTEPRRAPPKPPQQQTGGPTKKEKAHKTDPSERYPWLANILDADRHPPDHPDYDPRTLYIPPMAWNRFSPFEKQ